MAAGEPNLQPEIGRRKRLYRSTSAPADLASLKERIARKEIILPPQQQVLCRFALAYPDLAATDTVKSLARRAGVSQTTAWGLAARLGFSGYGAFRKLFQTHLIQNYQASHARAGSELDASDQGRGAAADLHTLSNCRPRQPECP